MPFSRPICTLNPNGIAPLTAVATITTRGAATIEWTLGRKGRPPLRRPANLSGLHRASPARNSRPLSGSRKPDHGPRDQRRTSDGKHRAHRSHARRCRMKSPLSASTGTYADYCTGIFPHSTRCRSMPFIADRYRQCALVSAGRRPEVRNSTAAERKHRLRHLRSGEGGRVHDAGPRRYGEWSVAPEFRDIHHDVFEKDNGNFLVTVNKVGIDTVEDFIVELDRRTGAIVKTWDLRQVLPRRSTFFADPRDWLHVNAVIHDPRDDSIIVSGQRQGVVQSHRGQSPPLDPRPSGWLGGISSNIFSPPCHRRNSNGTGDNTLRCCTPDGDLMLFDNGFGREYGSAARLFAHRALSHFRECGRRRYGAQVL